MSGHVTVAPGRPSAAWTVTVPGSKSLTNRALLLAGVAAGRSRLHGGLDAADTAVMRAALAALGVSVEDVEPGVVAVGGLTGPPTGPAVVNCGMAGTVGRFLLPVLGAGAGRFEVDAHPQLRRRPLGPVLGALTAQGAEIDGDAFPLTVEAHGLSGGVIDVDASLSSQFLSGLMLAAPLARADTELRFRATVSAPYIGLTAAVMAAFGASVARTETGVTVRAGGYRACEYHVEPDASTASYFLAAAALTGSAVTLPGLSRARAGQGDIRLADHLVQMGATLSDSPGGLTLHGPAGALTGVHVDMADATDVFMTLACVAPFANTPTTIEGLANVRVKESDRLAATAENLRRLGIGVEEGHDSLTVHPGRPRPATRLPTFEDHRIAMAFSLIGLRVPVTLEDPEVVAKTCPTFWELWPSTGAEVRRW
ncbi:3-phosphoshikimate 1-carboxyvinyltransferase [Conexibacter sp. DBS9H8]|uniref:3-phosphoshikimate 1-carboxyvinyltransferase n=1 Tax=Conexibacter sp. DBS9H8 TaxID=2937801 RepID=UPI00200FB79A|nr:3-phosphoshikimate 1-carboxyvinyltransferase [Conexibacter sp. DBS9H8]